MLASRTTARHSTTWKSPIGQATLKGRLDRQVVANQAPTLDVALAGDALDLDALRALTGLFTGQDAGDNVLDHKIKRTVQGRQVYSLWR